MRNTWHFGRNFYKLRQLETISRKLASPAGPLLTEDEYMVLAQLRHKESTSSHLRLLDQFFANNKLSLP